MITRHELIQQTFKKTSASRRVTTEVVDTFLKLLSENIKANNSIKIRNFGTFHVNVKPERIQKGFGTIHEVSSSRHIKFSPALKLKKL